MIAILLFLFVSDLHRNLPVCPVIDENVPLLKMKAFCFHSGTELNFREIHSCALKHCSVFIKIRLKMAIAFSCCVFRVQFKVYGTTR